LRKGFGIVKRSTHKKGWCILPWFLCLQQTQEAGRESNVPPLPERNRPVLGTECKAMLTISDPGFLNRRVITKVNLEHNHVLTPDSSYLSTTYRSAPLRFKKELDGDKWWWCDARLVEYYHCH
jgi:hypothetical protein